MYLTLLKVLNLRERVCFYQPNINIVVIVTDNTSKKPLYHFSKTLEVLEQRFTKSAVCFNVVRNVDNKVSPSVISP